MGLEAFTSDDSETHTEPDSVTDKEKFQKEELCPDCGKEGKHLRGNEWKCTTPSEKCEVITWFNSGTEGSNASV